MQSGECKLIETYAGGKMFETLCLKKYTKKNLIFLTHLIFLERKCCTDGTAA